MALPAWPVCDIHVGFISSNPATIDKGSLLTIKTVRWSDGPRLPGVSLGYVPATIQKHSAATLEMAQ
jgi:hypothetical protein